LGLPDIDGLELCTRFQEIERVPVIMLTARDAVSDRVQGLRVGADDYVVKPFDLDELVARIEAVLRRRPPGTRELTYDDLRIDLDRRRVVRGAREVALTRTEFDILDVLARRADRVVARDSLASAVWPDVGVMDDSVLDSHVTNLRRKLEAGGERRIVQTVRGIGFTLR
ncbi:MAG: response regulator transcription factor, partial [Dehalococcoidia bacterium]